VLQGGPETKSVRYFAQSLKRFDVFMLFLAHITYCNTSTSVSVIFIICGDRVRAEPLRDASSTY